MFFNTTFILAATRVSEISNQYREGAGIVQSRDLLFFVVPVVAILFGVAKGFGFETMLKRELFEKFPGEAQQEVLWKVYEYAESLLQVTKSGVIAGIGLIILFWSVINVLSEIEGALNDIWEIRESRSWGRKFSDYLAIMMISPIFILMSGSITVFIKTQLTLITQKVALLGILSPLISFSFELTPYVLVWILFTILYIIMPNTRVSLKAGFLGGVVAGTLYQIAQWAYISFQISTAKFNAIYGSLAALPLFLMYLQISWWIVLFGAELSFANQNVDTYEFEPDSLKVSPRYKKLLTLQIIHLLIKRFENGDPSPIDSQISKQLHMPIRLVHVILSRLVKSGLVSEIKTKSDKEFAYQPARDINQLTIQSVLQALDHEGIEDIPVAKTEDYQALSEALQDFSEAMERLPANKLLKDI